MKKTDDNVTPIKPALPASAAPAAATLPGQLPDDVPALKALIARYDAELTKVNAKLAKLAKAFNALLND